MESKSLKTSQYVISAVCGGGRAKKEIKRKYTSNQAHIFQMTQFKKKKKKKVCVWPDIQMSFRADGSEQRKCVFKQ